jgi:hypothetical protein
MSSRSFGNVTQAVWECVKAASIKDHQAVYDPSDGDQGTVSTPTVVGTVVLTFVFDPATASVSYTIKDKPLLVPESAMWDGIQQSFDGCIKSCGD